MSMNVVEQLERYYAQVDSVDTPIDPSEVADRLEAVSPLPRAESETRSWKSSWVAFAAAAVLILVVALPLLWASSGGQDATQVTTSSPTITTQVVDVIPLEETTPTVVGVPDGPSPDADVTAIREVKGIPTPMGFAGTRIAAVIEPVDAPIVSPSTGPVTDPTGTVIWTNYAGSSDGLRDPHIMRVDALPQGGFITYSAAGGRAWYSRDGTDWVDVTDVESIYAKRVMWIDGSLAATRSVSVSSEGDWESDRLWLNDGDRWAELDTPLEAIISRPVHAGDTTLIVATSLEERDDVYAYLIVGTGDQYVTVDAPWDVKEWLSSDGVRQEVTHFGTADGTFVLLIASYRTDDLVGSVIDSSGLWTSDDGIDWSYMGDIPFTTAQTFGLETAAVRNGSSVVAMQTEGPDHLNSYWTTRDGLDWTEVEVSEDDFYWTFSNVEPTTLTWYNQDGSPVAYAGGLVIAGDPFRFSTDDGATWFEIGPDELDGPLVPFSDNGIAGDLLFSTAGDGLWIGVANEYQRR